MSRFIFFAVVVFIVGGDRGYTQAELLGFMFEAVAVYAVLGLVDRPLNRLWTSTRIHKSLVAWFTRAIDGVYAWLRRTKHS